MQITKIVFSPTGGTQKIADILSDELAKELDAEITQIDLAEPFIDETSLEVDKDSLVVYAAPCFGGRVPAVATERFSRIKSNGAKCVVINVYGNRDYDDALLEMEDSAANSGFEVIAAIAAIAEHSIMHQFATGRPDDTDKKNLTEFAEKIAERLKAGEKTTTPRVPGNNPYMKAGAVPMVPKVSNKCVSCGECAKTCPVTAINSVDYASDKDVCIACMRCIQVCPQKARSISKTMVAAASLMIKKAAEVRKEADLFI